MKTIRIITLVTFLAFLNSCQKEDLSLTETEENSVTPVTEMESSETIEPELAFPGQQGEVINLTPGAKHPTIVEKFGDTYILGGDMILTEEQVEVFSASGGDQNKTGINKFNAVQPWPNGIVYYTIDPTLPDQQRITDAMAALEAYYPYIDFEVRTNQTNYINFIPSIGCWSLIGMVGGVQEIGLELGCGTGSVAHEILHAMGLFHEQMRADRNSYVTIHDNNIENGQEDNFKTYAQVGYSGFQIGTYDFTSIMGYGSYFFSTNGNPTITKLDNTTFAAQRNQLTDGDVQTLHFIYNSELGPGSAMYPLAGNVNDFGWNNNHLTNYGIQFVGNAAYFDGSSYAETAGSSYLSGTQPRSISAFINTTASNGTIVSWGDENSTNKWAFKIQNGKIGVDIGDGYVYGSTSINNGNPFHVACTFSGTTVSDIKLYVNGNLETVSSIQNPNAWVTTKWAPPAASGIRIGRDVESLTDYFTGYMIHVFISEAGWPTDLVEKVSKTLD